MYEAQKEKPAKGDWIKLVKADLALIGETLDERKFKSMKETQFKRFEKMNIEKSAFY